MGKCKDCQWWIKNRGYSSCDKVNHDYNDGDTAFEIEADADDDQGLEVELITGPEFGCVLFKGKDI
jgi:hypothetical protein